MKPYTGPGMPGINRINPSTLGKVTQLSIRTIIENVKDYAMEVLFLLAMAVFYGLGGYAINTWADKYCGSELLYFLRSDACNDRLNMERAYGSED